MSLLGAWWRFVRSAPAMAGAVTWMAVVAGRPRRGLYFASIYAYFRWLDDRVDDPALAPTGRRALEALLARQAQLLTGSATAAGPERWLLAALACPGMHAAAEVMLGALAFDAARRWTDARPTPEAVLGQAGRIGEAFTRGLHAAFGQGAWPPELGAQGAAATLVHMARDREVDTGLGYQNVPFGGSEGAAWQRAALVEARATLARPIPLAQPRPLRVLVGLYRRRYRRVADRLLGAWSAPGT